MKKLLALSLILVMILCSCAGVNKDDKKTDGTDNGGITNEKEPKIEYWIGGSDELLKDKLPENVSIATAGTPFPYFPYNDSNFEMPLQESNYYENANAPRTKELRINSKRCLLEYQHSYDRRWDGSNITEDVYSGGPRAVFHSESGKLTELLHGSVKTKGDLEQLNKDVAVGMCDDAVRIIYGESIFEKDGFKLTSADFYDYDYENPYYVIVFTRKINGYMTAEKIMIRINTSGWIDTIFAFGIGMFDRITELPSEEEMDKAYTLLLSCISDEYLKTLEPPYVTVSNTGTVYLSVESSVKRDDGTSLRASINIEKY